MNLPKLNKKVNTPAFTLNVTEREKKLLALLGILILMVISYYLLYQPLSDKTEVLKAEKARVEVKVVTARANLQNEAQIQQEYTTTLEKVNKNAAPFFPKVYPYKDRYILLVEKAVTIAGATAAGVSFADPEVGGAPQSKQDKFTLPDYPLQDLAKTINKANPQYTPAPEVPKAPVAAKAANATAKTLPSDAMLRLPAKLQVTGTYAQIRAVIANFEKLKRAVTIESVSMGMDKGTVLKADFTLSFYALEKVDNGADPFNNWTVQGSYGKPDLFN